MVSNFDHVTVVVTELEEAKRFFELLGFEVDQSVVISGARMASYLGLPGIEADHVTMVLADAQLRQEVQLLRYRSPAVVVDTGSGDLARTGFNHVCLRVTDLDQTVAELVAGGVELRNKPMVFHDRKLVFLNGPSDVVVELAEWVEDLPRGTSANRADGG